MSRSGRYRTGRVANAALAGCVLAALAAPASAHSGSLGGSVADATVPTWLVVLTGGVVVGGSFVFTSLLTDHEAIRDVNWRRLTVPVPAGLRVAAAGVGRTVSVGLLGAVVVVGIRGPETADRNFALLFVWAGWWAGYAATTYLAGNTWPALDPWRALARAGRRAARALGHTAGNRDFPARYGVWPAVAGLLAMVWLEVVSPVGENPRVLAGLVAAYTLVTVAGAVGYGEAWFARADPISRVFAAYGRLAPVQRTADGLAVRLPGSALTEQALPDRPGETAFVVALLWVTTYDGLVATPAWTAAVDPLVSLGVPALAVYAAVLLGGFGLFFGVYRRASRRVRDRADTYVTAATIERWFAPALLPIAAGYHLAHFLGYFLGLAPALAAVTAAPFAPPATPLVFVLPEWFGTVKLLCVLAGHVLAVWVAHSLAFELFPGVLAAIRSQFHTVAVMICYTVVSLWIITQPYVPPPYV